MKKLQAIEQTNKYKNISLQNRRIINVSIFFLKFRFFYLLITKLLFVSVFCA